jgi:DMSO/TMAO reductase YedYZ heme-binding membrane subunit
VVHYVWLVKSDTRVPYLYGAILVVLLILHTRPAKQGIAFLRQRARAPVGGSALLAARSRATARAPREAWRCHL